MKDLSMMTPSEIAFEYDGDKKKIGQAVQRGIIDATAAALAGIFIDRMVQSTLKAPQTTVYEDMYGSNDTAQQEIPMSEQVAYGYGGGSVADLPVRDDFFNYAGGGIVAFAGRDGSFVETRPGFYELEDEDEGGSSAELDLLRRYMGFREAERAKLPAEAREAARKFYEGSGERAEKLSQQQMALAGLGAAGALLSTRGGVGKALAAAEKEARPGLQRAIESRGAAEESRIKGLLGLEEKERAERLEDIKGAEGLAGKEIQRRLSRDTDAKAAVNAYVDAERERIASGLRKPASDAQLRAEAWTTIRKEMYGPRAQQAEAATFGGQLRAGDYAVELRNKNKRIYDLARIDPKGKSPELVKRIEDAKAVRQQLENEIARVTGFLGSSSGAAGGSSGGGSGGGGQWSIKPLQ